jgi:hypothetical protein
VTVEGLKEHWKQARVNGGLEARIMRLGTENVTDLTLNIPAGYAPTAASGSTLGGPTNIVIDEQTLAVGQSNSDRSFTASLHKVGDKWQLGKRPEAGLRKVHGLQGPIDDAFLDSFIFVRPTGQAANELAGKWAAAELQRAIEHWRRHFRGEARVKDDTAITPQDIASANLVVWGDTAANQLLKKVAGKLPIQWDEKQITVGEQTYASDKHALVAIYPNPLNPKRYIVLNSSFTFRDYAYLNNARQVSMLPDWAVVDLTTPPGNVWPGKIVAADFFDEAWKLKSTPAAR